MSDIHIDDFFKDGCKILVHLYNNFPRTCMLFVDDISGPDEPDEFGLHSTRHQSCFSTMLWLADAGYMSYDDRVRQEGLDQAVLTHKGFLVLNARSPLAKNQMDNNLPESVQEFQKTNISVMREALKNGTSADIRRIGYQVLLQSREHD